MARSAVMAIVQLLRVGEDLLASSVHDDEPSRAVQTCRLLIQVGRLHADADRQNFTAKGFVTVGGRVDREDAAVGQYDLLRCLRAAGRDPYGHIDVCAICQSGQL